MEFDYDYTRNACRNQLRLRGITDLDDLDDAVAQAWLSQSRGVNGGLAVVRAARDVCCDRRFADRVDHRVYVDAVGDVRTRSRMNAAWREQWDRRCKLAAERGIVTRAPEATAVCEPIRLEEIGFGEL